MLFPGGAQPMQPTGGLMGSMPMHPSPPGACLTAAPQAAGSGQGMPGMAGPAMLVPAGGTAGTLGAMPPTISAPCGPMAGAGAPAMMMPGMFPQVAGMPGMPGMPGVPGMPGMLGMPGMPGMMSAAAPASGGSQMSLAAKTELEQAVERFIANSDIDSRAIASLRAQDPEVQRAVLDRGELADCQNPSAALMGRIQVAKDHVNFERSAAGTARTPLAVADTGMASPGGVPPNSSPEVEEFIRENRLDDSAARALRDAELVVQRSVLILGNFKNCRNPSAVCLARIREARIVPVATPEDRPEQLGLSSNPAKKTELEEELDRFLEENDVDSRASSALRAQTAEVQRAVLERGELTDCQNPSTALMGRIRVAHENIAFERKRMLTPMPDGTLALTAAKEPPAASPEVEDFIKENKIDGLAARQLREADQETQEDVVARGSLSDCRNPSAVLAARIRDAQRGLGKGRPAKGKGKGKGKKGGGGGGITGDEIEAAYQAIKKDTTVKRKPGAERCNEYSEKTLKACALWRENECYLDAVEELVFYFHKAMPKGDGAILIFLPGWGDITKCYIRLFQSGENFKLITLHSLMTPEQQHEAFERPPKGMRKIVLSTNIAEASVTIDDIVYVIDTGVRKERTYDPAVGISSLDTKMVTKANAIQRRGRAGRCQEGLVVHLFPSYKFESFEQFPTPQMLTSSMEEVLLQSKVIHGGSNSEISDMLTNSMAAPKLEAVTSGVNLLKGMNCLTRAGELTVLGRAVAAIPVQPNVAKFLLVAAAFRCIKPAACIAAFLSIKSPFQQSVSTEKSSKVTGKDYFNKGFASDHLTMLQAYVEWRQEVARGRGDEFCDETGLSPETLDMAYMMVQQFVSFMVDAGYDGADVTEGDYGEVDPVRRGSDEDALVRAAMVCGFMPNVCVLYRGQRSPYWYLDSNEEVSAFRGSANADYAMKGQDGDEWMVFSDSMKMGRFNSIMDSSLVFSPFVLLFADALMLNEKKGEIRFDKWYAYAEKGPWQRELLELRQVLQPGLKEAIESRDLSSFPRELADRVSQFCKQRPISLRGIEPVSRSIDEEAAGPARAQLSHFEWPEDLGAEEEEED
mmetsp:Transcript_63576/g.204842  ORF Transcript_63576/g.204842 Transcript_63576/m.204842 type:complete len:1089 (+) Transcript_63576:104-3370(+)